MTKVLLIVVDALTDRFLRPLMDSGELPYLELMRSQGQMRTNISIFPSITHACLSSIATGCYPRDHHVLGGHWYLPDEASEAYYGTDPNIIFHEGIDDFFEDFIKDLNGKRLNGQTIFQAVEQSGHAAASLNFMIFKGDVDHNVNLPFLISLVPGFNDDGLTVKGPSTLYLGEFVASSGPNVPDLEVRGGPKNWFGFQDENSGFQLLQLAHRKAFPDFTLAYFPRNDYRSHSMGPQEAHYKLKELDATLGKMFEAYGGSERFLDEMCIVITGDHSQTPIGKDDEAGISLSELLEDAFDTAMEGEAWESDYEVMACPNLRAAQLYFKDPRPNSLKQAIEILHRDARIDQVIWRSHDLNGDGQAYCIANAEQRLLFRRGSRATDLQGNRWDWEGCLAVVDGRVQDGQITFGDYPNAFERLEGILDSSHSGHLWVTARPGYEFESPLAGIHRGGGSHGSLHAGDSLSSLILAGNYGDYELPTNPRLVDIKPICLDLLAV